MVCSAFFQFFLSAKLHFSICEMREMTSFSMKSIHFDLNEAAKCVDMPLTSLASLSRTRTKYKMATTFGLIVTTVGDVTTWKELPIGVRQLVKLLFENNCISPGLVL